MKKLFLSLVILLGMSMCSYAYEEIVDIEVGTETYKRVKVNSGQWTVILDSTTELYLSTTTSGSPSNAFQLSYYNVRNDAGSDIDVVFSIDNSTAASLTGWPVSDGEVVTYRSKKTRYARLYEGVTSTVTVRVEKNYIGGR